MNKGITSMTPETIRTIQTAIATATREELNVIISAVNTRTKQISLKQKSQFRVNQRVKCKGKRSDFFGAIQKINRKNIIVKDEKTGQLWNVSPTFLSPAPKKKAA